MFIAGGACGTDPVQLLRRSGGEVGWEVEDLLWRKWNVRDSYEADGG